MVNQHVSKRRLNAVSILPGTMFGPYDYLIGTGMYLLSLYHNKMPAVLAGGLPLAHVMDVAEGHLLAMEKAEAGSHYILTGMKEDNRYFRDLAKIIVSTLRKKFPDKKFITPTMIIPSPIAMAGAFISEQYAILFNQPMLLSRDAVRAGVYPAFYTYQNAYQDLGYKPKRTFKQAVVDMLDYYIKHNLLQSNGRWIDKR